MIVYSEEKLGPQSVFYKKILDVIGTEISTRKIALPLYKAEQNGYTYFLLYDYKMQIISSVFEYLNYELQISPFTTRSKAAHALRFLYCFLELSGYSVTEVDETVLDQLISFLKGINGGPEQHSMKTLRASDTINGYLSVYRDYFKAMDIPSRALFRHHTVNAKTSISKDFNTTTQFTKYENNLKTSKHVADTVPKYISPSDFKKLFKLVLQKKDKTAKIILHLAYGYGLRLGEILGITMEDIQEVSDNGKLIPVITLRNRISDNRFQFAKGLMHVIDKRQYYSKEYLASRWRITITYDFYEQLLKYIEEKHVHLQEAYPDNYEKSQADIVSYRDRPECNYYVFLNKYGRVFSDQTWNKQLRDYFGEAGIPVDVRLRENNLTHRFRHGFAMFHARFSPHPVDALVLQKMMRHASISSTMVYYNPTPEDEFQTKTEFQEDLYSMIPELKEGFEVANTDGDDKE